MHKFIHPCARDFRGLFRLISLAQENAIILPFHWLSAVAAVGATELVI